MINTFASFFFLFFFWERYFSIVESSIKESNFKVKRHKGQNQKTQDIYILVQLAPQKGHSNIPPNTKTFFFSKIFPQNDQYERNADKLGHTRNALEKKNSPLVTKPSTDIYN